ncbi:MAG: lipopolysaccharide biosynthesis protein [Planctomycetota bacterium]
MLSKSLVLGANVVTGILTARALGPTGRGELTALNVGPALLAGILTLGIPSSIVYNFKRSPEDRAQLLGAALLLCLMLGCASALVGVWLLPYWLSEFSPDVVRAAQWFMLNAPIVLLMPVCSRALEASGVFRLSNTVRVLVPTGTLALLAGATALGWLSPIRAALCYVLGGAPVLWMIVRLWRLHRPTLPSLGALRRLTGFGLRSYGIDALHTLSRQIDQVIVVGVLAATLVGIYAVGLSAARLLNVVQESVVIVLFPKTASKSPTQVVAAVGLACRWTLALTFVLGLVVFAFGPGLLRLMYGERFVEAAPLLRLLVVDVLLASAVAVLTQSFMSLGRPGVVALLQGAGLMLAVPLMLWWVPEHGLMGAGAALLASTTVRLLSVLICYPLVLGLRPPWPILRPADVGALCRRLRSN